MHVKSISGTVTTTVVLGEGNYGNKLTVTSTGAILPSAYGADAVYASVTGVVLTNEGLIAGHDGAYEHHETGGAGGVGVELEAGGKLINVGSIRGGSGGYGAGRAAGGIGVEMASGAISTQGTIIGGDGAAGAYFGYGFQGAGGDGGIGVLLTSGTITNQGLIEGGRGGYALRDAAGAAGVGVEMTTGTVINHGSIRGGYGGYSYNSLAGMGGDGVRFISIGTVSNTGAITGGVGGSSVENVADTPGIGVDLASGGSIANSGAITGGFGGFGAVRTPGGVGVAMSGGGSLTNSGTISGGQGSYSDPAGSQTGAMGGTAIQSNDGAIINRGKIAGGAGGNTSRSLSGVGGTGIAMVSGHLLNKGEITGGSGGANNYFGYGSGGTGVVLVGGGTITNQGTILGGFGSSGGTGIEIGAGTLLNTGLLEGGPGVSTQMYGDNGGTGGVGLLIYAGTTVVSAGTIVGGHGGSSYYTGGNGGVGVDIDGGALRVTGKISGGTPGAGGEGSGGYGAAIQFGAAAATLEVTPSAHFNGDIVANSQVDDTLVLEGKTAGTLSGFGTTITGFRTIDEDASGHWTLAGDIAGEVSLSIGTDATLTLNGIVSIAAVGFDVGGGERLDLDAPMQFTSALSGFGTGDTINLVGLQATSLKYGGHILNLLNAEGSIVETLTIRANTPRMISRYTPCTGARRFSMPAPMTSTKECPISCRLVSRRFRTSTATSVPCSPIFTW